MNEYLGYLEMYDYHTQLANESLLIARQLGEQP